MPESLQEKTDERRRGTSLDRRLVREEQARIAENKAKEEKERREERLKQRNEKRTRDSPAKAPGDENKTQRVTSPMKEGLSNEELQETMQGKSSEGDVPMDSGQVGDEDWVSTSDSSVKE